MNQGLCIRGREEGPNAGYVAEVEEERPNNRTLGDTTSDGACGRLVRAQSDIFLSIGQVGPEPEEGYV